jgi:hypothetical protein
MPALWIGIPHKNTPLPRVGGSNDKLVKKLEFYKPDSSWRILLRACSGDNTTTTTNNNNNYYNQNRNTISSKEGCEITLF